MIRNFNLSLMILLANGEAVQALIKPQHHDSHTQLREGNKSLHRSSDSKSHHHRHHSTRDHKNVGKSKNIVVNQQQQQQYQPQAAAATKSTVLNSNNDNDHNQVTTSPSSTLNLDLLLNAMNTMSQTITTISINNITIDTKDSFNSNLRTPLFEEVVKAKTEVVTSDAAAAAADSGLPAQKIKEKLEVLETVINGLDFDRIMNHMNNNANNGQQNNQNQQANGQSQQPNHDDDPLLVNSISQVEYYICEVRKEILQLKEPGSPGASETCSMDDSDADPGSSGSQQDYYSLLNLNHNMKVHNEKIEREMKAIENRLDDLQTDYDVSQSESQSPSKNDSGVDPAANNSVTQNLRSLLAKQRHHISIMQKHYHYALNHAVKKTKHHLRKRLENYRQNSRKRFMKEIANRGSIIEKLQKKVEKCNGESMIQSDSEVSESSGLGSDSMSKTKQNNDSHGGTKESESKTTVTKDDQNSDSTTKNNMISDSDLSIIDTLTSATSDSDSESEAKLSGETSLMENNSKSKSQIKGETEELERKLDFLMMKSELSADEAKEMHRIGKELEDLDNDYLGIDTGDSHHHHHHHHHDQDSESDVDSLLDSDHDDHELPTDVYDVHYSEHQHHANTQSVVTDHKGEIHHESDTDSDKDTKLLRDENSSVL